MLSDVDIKLDGFEEIEKLLKKLPDKPAEKALRAGVRSGGNIIKKAAQQRVPIDSGTLEKSIFVKTQTKNFRQTGVMQVAIATQSGRTARHDAYYAHMVEFGTSKMGARPFMRPALEENTQKVINKAGQIILKRIEKEAEKLAR